MMVSSARAASTSSRDWKRAASVNSTGTPRPPIRGEVGSLSRSGQPRQVKSITIQPCLASAQWSASRRVSPSRAAQVERDWSITPVFRTELAEVRQRDATLKVVQRHGGGHRRLGLCRGADGLCFRLDTWGDTRKCRNAGRQCAATPSASCRRDKAHCNSPIPHSLHQSSRAYTIVGGSPCITDIVSSSFPRPLLSWMPPGL
jgi:hypothetical protein